MQFVAHILAISVVALTVPPTGTADEKAFLTAVRRLTFAGQRAGEGYFSADGSRLVFQSEREPGNPFYQIYELSLETGDTRRVSPGVGKTTCAFFRPGSGEILFSSTHHDSESRALQEAELEFRASGQERRYAWDFDPQMDIYVAEGAVLRRLTQARGYDAEGSYSPDGDRVVFSSTRGAYEGELTEEDRRRLEVDPSYFAEIYLMRADGSEQRRLTRAVGYDGGPFFTHDGRNIVWRRFDADGLIADLWTMRADGSEQRRITDFSSMSWAPFPHPSGEYFVFTSNKLGFDNFELFLVDRKGLKEPVRVTFTPGFDGLPAFSPDGETLAWTSKRGGKAAQLYFGRWNHDAAREALRQAPAPGSAGP